MRPDPGDEKPLQTGGILPKGEPGIIGSLDYGCVIPKTLLQGDELDGALRAGIDVKSIISGPGSLDPEVVQAAIDKTMESIQKRRL